MKIISALRQKVIMGATERRIIPDATMVEHVRSSFYIKMAMVLKFVFM